MARDHGMEAFGWRADTATACLCRAKPCERRADPAGRADHPHALIAPVAQARIQMQTEAHEGSYYWRRKAIVTCPTSKPNFVTRARLIIVCGSMAYHHVVELDFIHVVVDRQAHRVMPAQDVAGHLTCRRADDVGRAARYVPSACRRSVHVRSCVVPSL
jgi:hypothetical protein